MIVICNTFDTGYASFNLGHMWWQNVNNGDYYNSPDSELLQGCYVTATGIVEQYNCNDIEFPCDQTYGITNVNIIKITRPISKALFLSLKDNND